MQTMDTQPARGAQAPTKPTKPAAAPGNEAAQQLNEQQLKHMQIMVRQAMGLLLEDQTAQTIVARAQQGNPAEVVAGMVVELLQQLHGVAKGKGVEVDMVTVLVAGVQIIGTLTEMLNQAGVVPDDQMPQFVGEASKLAIDKHNAEVSAQGAA